MYKLYSVVQTLSYQNIHLWVDTFLISLISLATANSFEQENILQEC